MSTFRVLLRMQANLSEEVEADSLAEAAVKAEDVAYLTAVRLGLDDTDWEVYSVTDADTKETVWLRGEDLDEDLD